MTTATEQSESSKARNPLRGNKTGTVVTDNRDKSIVVAIDFQFRHAKYGKLLRRTTKLHVHDENNEARIGDKVEIANCRPISKTKSWRLVKITAQTPQD